MKIKLISVFFVLLSIPLFSQNDKLILAFYSAISDSQEKSTIKMTQDFFYSQINALNQYTIIDKRTEKWSENTSVIENVAFFPEIQEKNGGWNCILNAIDVSSGKKFTKDEQYESYYKILMDSKYAIVDLLSLVNASHENTISVSNSVPNKEQTNIPLISLEKLSGTWKAENFVDKVIILRGGRGFVIFKNGASMNIKLAIVDNVIIATQTSKTNASYFPDIPRNIALEVAASAKPIEWRLKVVNNDILSGEKLTIKNNSENSIEGVVVPVEWNRLN